MAVTATGTARELTDAGARAAASDAYLAQTSASGYVRRVPRLCVRKGRSRHVLRGHPFPERGGVAHAARRACRLKRRPPDRAPGSWTCTTSALRISAEPEAKRWHWRHFSAVASGSRGAFACSPPRTTGSSTPPVSDRRSRSSWDASASKTCAGKRSGTLRSGSATCSSGHLSSPSSTRVLEADPGPAVRRRTTGRRPFVGSGRGHGGHVVRRVARILREREGRARAAGCRAPGVGLAVDRPGPSLPQGAGSGRSFQQHGRGGPGTDHGGGLGSRVLPEPPGRVPGRGGGRLGPERGLGRRDHRARPLDRGTGHRDPGGALRTGPPAEGRLERRARPGSRWRRGRRMAPERPAGRSSSTWPKTSDSPLL